jgi:glycosyltransferase involved in cell wall biosynthesis
MSNIGKVLVVGSNCIINRTPTFLAEIARRASSFKVIQRRFYTSRDSSRRLVRFLYKFLGSIHYFLALPLSVSRADWVFLTASNNPEILVLSFWARLFRKPILVDYYVSFYEWTSLMMKTIQPDSRLARKFAKADKVALAQAGVIHFNRCEIEHIRKLLVYEGSFRDPHVIPLFSRFDQNISNIKFPQAAGPVRFVWWGSLMPLHGLDLILAAFEQVAAIRTDFELHLCFLDVRRAESMLADFGACDRAWLRVHDKLTLSDGSLPRFVNENADIGFSHFGVGEQAEYVGSNKIIEAMALGRTSIVADTTGNRELPGIQELFMVCDRTVPALAEKIREVIDQPEVLRDKGSKCRGEFLNSYSTYVAERLFASVIDDFLAGQGSRPD